MAMVVAEAVGVEVEETRGREIFYASRIHIDFACGGPVQVSAAVLLLLPPAERANPPSLGRYYVLRGRLCRHLTRME